MFRFPLLLALLLTAAASLVAAPLPQSAWLASVATTWPRTPSEEWAYLCYQSADAASLAGRTLAIYRKDGEAASPGVFTRQAVTQLQDHAAVIAPLLDRSVNVGENLAELDEHVTGLFQTLVPAPALSLAEKLAAVIQGLNSDPSLHHRVLLLTRRHPGAALAFGMGWAEPLPAGIDVFTYEIRDFDPQTSSDRSVVARLVVRRGQPLILPAPGIPVEVPTNSPIADLLTRLRWATPDPLRRLAPAQQGFNVYRVRSDRATALGFLTTTPKAGVLAELARTGLDVERVNRQPVVPAKEFSAADVANFAGDATTLFLTDDRSRYTGGAGFQDGDQFCYFVAARDLLGRDGDYSPGACVKVCDRVPPSAPGGLKTANDFVIENGKGVQRLRVTWRPAPEADNQKVNRYAIYRWNDRTELHDDADRALPIAFVNHRVGTNRFSFVDQTPTAPGVTADAGKVFWYTVRAVQDTACGPLTSPNSAPVRAIPRDRVGPTGEAPTLTVRSPVPVLQSFPLQVEGGGGNLAPNAVRYLVRMVRTTREIATVDVTIHDSSLAGGQASLGRHYFHDREGATAAHATTSDFNTLEWSYVSTNRGVITVGVTSGLANGVSAPPQLVTLRVPPPGNFAGGVECRLSLQWESVPADATHRSHYPRAIVPELNLGTAPVTGIPVSVPLTPDAHQWRLYRRLDDGPLSLIAEGDVPLETTATGARRNARTAATATQGVTDDAMPINVASATYYSQLLDTDGNAGKLVASVAIAVSTPPPAPSALSLLPGGGTNDPLTTMTLTWSAAPYGLARYRIWIGNPLRSGLPVLQAVIPAGTGTGGSTTARRQAQPAALSPALATRTTYLAAPAVYRDFVTDAGVTNLPCTVIDTTLVGGRVGFGPVYSNLLTRATAAADLYVLIESVAADGTVGGASTTQVMRKGAGAVSTNPLVPWPRRPLPPAREDFTGSALQVTAERIRNGNLNGSANTDFNGIGVAIGYTSIQTKAGVTATAGRMAWLDGAEDPESRIFQDPETGRPLFGQVILSGTTTRPPGIELPVFLISQPPVSAALYRQQVPSPTFPQPPGDVLQVTPLMERIAHTIYDSFIPVNAPVAIPGTQIVDPFVGIFPVGNTHGIYLLDTQPIIENATYQYYLVRFDEYGEPIEVLPTNPVTATP